VAAGSDSVPIKVEDLARAKELPASALRRFGLEDCAEGVRFRYTSAPGAPARPRLRTALRGADGSSWDPASDLPISVYHPPDPPAAPRVDFLILVEGESDCWTAWLHGVPAVGIPGAAAVDALQPDDLRDVRRVYVLIENEAAQTYPDGVAAYVRRLCARIRTIGFDGPVFELRMPDGLSDLNDLYRRHRQGFPEALQAALASAAPLDTPSAAEAG
jgi:hypothetical protein